VVPMKPAVGSRCCARAGALPDVPASQQIAIAPKGRGVFSSCSKRFFPVRALLPEGINKSLRVDSRQPRARSTERPECLSGLMLAQLELMWRIDEFWSDRGLHEADRSLPRANLNTLHEAHRRALFRHQPNRRGHCPRCRPIFKWRHVQGDTGAESAVVAASSTSPPLPTSQAMRARYPHPHLSLQRAGCWEPHRLCMKPRAHGFQRPAGL